MHSTYSRTLVWNITGSESFLVAYYIGLNTVPSKFLFTYRLCMWPYLETVLHCCHVKRGYARLGWALIQFGHTQRLPCEDRHRLNNASISQTRSASASNHQSLETSMEKTFPRASRGPTLPTHWLQTSSLQNSPVREYFLLFWDVQSVVFCYGSPRKLILKQTLNFIRRLWGSSQNQEINENLCLRGTRCIIKR